MDDTPADPVAAFLTELTNERTRETYGYTIRALIRDTGARHPADLTPEAILKWCTAARANNSVRSRATRIAAFLDWCARNDVPAPGPSILTDRRSPVRRYPPTYGKVQAQHPARWLTKEEAFTDLIDACKDGTVVGLRDEVAVRLGLTGMRATEIGTLPTGAVLRVNADPTVTWTGKGYKPRRIVAGPTLVGLIAQWLELYAASLDRALTPTDTLICRLHNTGRARTQLVEWGQPFSDARKAVHKIVSTRAALAGLGHVAPHDLRRSAAGILHHERAGDGGHRFDLLDIQKVLGHADPATTMRSYLDPMDTEVIGRAGAVLD